jgi:hypothetical protein
MDAQSATPTMAFDGLKAHLRMGHFLIPNPQSIKDANIRIQSVNMSYRFCRRHGHIQVWEVIMIHASQTALGFIQLCVQRRSAPNTRAREVVVELERFGASGERFEPEARRVVAKDLGAGWDRCCCYKAGLAERRGVWSGFLAVGEVECGIGDAGVVDVTDQ